MHILEQLGLALGLASLAGVNLYLTVLITGLAIRFDWVHLADRYQQLDVLGHPAVLAVAGVMFLLQFFADKVPWVDSLWDSLHTIIRPVGGTLLAIQALGDMPTYVQVTAALLAGGAALTTHGAKAGTRLLINHSPEPATNITMSLGEDIAVVGGMALVMLRPVIALVVFSVVLVLLWMIFPRLWRIIRTTLWLAWHKLRMPGRRYPLLEPEKLAREMNDELRDLLKFRANVAETDVVWSVPCLSGKSKGLRGISPNLRGLLVGTSSGDALLFVANKLLRDRIFRLPLSGTTVETESKFLSENVVLEARDVRVVFRFPRGQGALAETIAMRVREMVKPASEVAAEQSVQEEAPKEVATAEPVVEKAAITVEEFPLPATADAPDREGRGGLMPLPSVG